MSSLTRRVGILYLPSAALLHEKVGWTTCRVVRVLYDGWRCVVLRVLKPTRHLVGVKIAMNGMARQIQTAICSVAVIHAVSTSGSSHITTAHPGTVAIAIAGSVTATTVAFAASRALSSHCWGCGGTSSETQANRPRKQNHVDSVCHVVRLPSSPDEGVALNPVGVAGGWT